MEVTPNHQKGLLLDLLKMSVGATYWGEKNQVDAVKWLKSQLQLINDIVPKSNTEYYQKYELMLKSFRDEIKNTNQIDILEKKHYDLTKDIETSLLNHLSKLEILTNS
jgi:hypothetical protein